MKCRKRSWWGVAFIGVSMGLSGCAASGVVVHGTIRPPGSKASGATASRPTLSRSRTQLAETVIYVDGAPAKTSLRTPAPRSHHGASLSCGRYGFEPSSIVVARGDSLAFVNRDNRWHRPFSVSTAGPFDMGSIGPHGRHAVRLTRPGALQVFCRLHSEPSASVFVAPTFGWVRADSAGRFTLPRLPAGTYDLKAWHPRYGERRWRVQLPPTDQALQLDF